MVFLLWSNLEFFLGGSKRLESSVDQFLKEINGFCIYPQRIIEQRELIASTNLCVHLFSQPGLVSEFSTLGFPLLSFLTPMRGKKPFMTINLH